MKTGQGCLRQAAQTYSSQLDFSTTVMEPSEAAVTANLRFWINIKINLWNDND